MAARMPTAMGRSNRALSLVLPSFRGGQPREEFRLFRVESKSEIVRGYLKMPETSLVVIPAKGGIQSLRAFLDPRLREGDGLGEF
jgi:hypothetical protein